MADDIEEPARIVPLPGVRIPVEQAAKFDPQVARVIEDLREGRIALSTGPEVYPDWSPEEVAKLYAALDLAFAESPADPA